MLTKSVPYVAPSTPSVGNLVCFASSFLYEQAPHVDSAELGVLPRLGYRLVITTMTFEDVLLMAYDFARSVIRLTSGVELSSVRL